MTKKDYVAIAAALKGSFPVPENNSPFSAWRNVVDAIAATLAQDNPRFDAKRFYAAAGVHLSA